MKKILIFAKQNMTKPLKIKIKRLGAIADSEIQLRPFMLFSGESGLGKSYIAALVHYIYLLFTSDRLKLYFEENKYDFNAIFEGRTPDGHLCHVSRLSLQQWINRDAVSYIAYFIGNPGLKADLEISFWDTDADFEFHFKQEKMGLSNKEEVLYKIMCGDLRYNIYSTSFKPSSLPFVSLLSALLQEEFLGNYSELSQSFVLPPSRGGLMDIVGEVKFRSGMYEEFMSLRDFIFASSPRAVTIDPSILQCLDKVNTGHLEIKENAVQYKTSQGIEIPLSASASSIKELAPLTLLLAKISPKHLTILFEEPEAHLHPERQMLIADLIASLVQSDCRFVVTTHSDFLIKRLNMLMKLKDMVDAPATAPQAQAILKKWDIPASALMNKDKVGAYWLKANGDGTSRAVLQSFDEGDLITFDSFMRAMTDDLMIDEAIDHASASVPDPRQ